MIAIKQFEFEFECTTIRSYLSVLHHIGQASNLARDVVKCVSFCVDFELWILKNILHLELMVTCEFYFFFQKTQSTIINAPHTIEHITWLTTHYQSIVLIMYGIRYSWT